jgi:hypothetical protein
MYIYMVKTVNGTSKFLGGGKRPIALTGFHLEELE